MKGEVYTDVPEFISGSETESLNTDVCIVGAGPAGMIMGLLLAKKGIDVVVLERNLDFHREFREEIHQPRFVQLVKN